MHQITLAYWKEDTKNSLVNCILASGVAPSENADSPVEFFHLCGELHEKGWRNMRNDNHKIFELRTLNQKLNQTY